MFVQETCDDVKAGLYSVYLIIYYPQCSNSRSPVLEELFKEQFEIINCLCTSVATRGIIWPVSNHTSYPFKMVPRRPKWIHTCRLAKIERKKG